MTKKMIVRTAERDPSALGCLVLGFTYDVGLHTADGQPMPEPYSVGCVNGFLTVENTPANRAKYHVGREFTLSLD